MKNTSVPNTAYAVEQSLHKLLFWLKQNGPYGYDPYDVLGCSLYLTVSKSSSLHARFIKKIIKYFDIFSPLLLRRLLKIEKEINAKAMGLFAKAYLDLYQVTHSKKFLIHAKESLTWLEDYANKNHSGLCWGYPFDWQWLHFIPRGTPSGVVTSTVGDAFYNFYKLKHEKKYLDVCISICEFFLNDLNIDYIDSDTICFSYTPIDQAHVLNANLLVADFLIRIGTTANISKYLQLGLKALNYTLREQNNDGSFYYFGRKDRTQYQLQPEILTKIDHYHTGFVLRSLYSIYKMTENRQLLKIVKKCLTHYINNLFKEKTIPKFMPEYTYPINIHSCAEAILCLSTLNKDFPEVGEILSNVTRWTIKEMQTDDGWFIYMIKRKMGLLWKIRIPFIRWGQAWMLRALSNYYVFSAYVLK